MARELDREIAHVLVNPLWEDIGWFSTLDVALARDRDVTTELLDEHFAVTGSVTRDDWDRMQFLRGALTPAHRAQLVDALEAAPRHGLVELLAFTCGTARELATALRKAGAGKALQPAIDYALRRFVREPAVAKQLWRRAKPYATSAARGKWRQEGDQAWRALFVTDTRAGADAVTQMIASTWAYTNHGVKERLIAASAKRARLLTFGSRCVPPLLAALPESYIDVEITQSAVALCGAEVKPALEAKWQAHPNLNSKPARTALGGLLALAPRSKVYQAAAAKVLPQMLKDRDEVAWDDVGVMGGIVTGIATGRVKALYPLLDKVAKWKVTGSPYDNHGVARAELAAALVRRRARRTLDGG